MSRKITRLELNNYSIHHLGSQIIFSTIHLFNLLLMANLLPATVDVLAKSTTEITSSIPIVGNAAICADSVCTTGRAGINFYCASNPIAKVFFDASCLCGVMGAVSSGTALATSFTGIPVVGWLGSFGARGFNRLGKYTLHMGNVTNATTISELMS